MQLNIVNEKGSDILNPSNEALQNDCDNQLIDFIAKSHPWFIAIPLVVVIVPILVFVSIILACLFIICLLLILLFEFYYERKNGSTTFHLLNFGTDYNDKEPHHAIIIAHKKNRDQNGLFPIRDYSGGINFVLMALRDHHPPIPYRIYDIDTVQKAIGIINNPNSKWLWIFGHGQRNKLKLANGLLCYYRLRDAPLKQFIGQYHCNSPLGNSLADYLHPPYSDVTRLTRFPGITQISVKKKLNELGI